MGKADEPSPGIDDLKGEGQRGAAFGLGAAFVAAFGFFSFSASTAESVASVEEFVFAASVVELPVLLAEAVPLEAPTAGQSEAAAADVFAAVVDPLRSEPS
jgi:hypothetical protein